MGGTGRGKGSVRGRESLQGREEQGLSLVLGCCRGQGAQLLGIRLEALGLLLQCRLLLLAPDHAELMALSLGGGLAGLGLHLEQA